MSVDFNALWAKARTMQNETELVRTLGQILTSKDGRNLVFNLDKSEAEWCIEMLDHALAEHKLRSHEKQAFFGTLRKLAGKHARLPDSMVITDTILMPNSSQPHTSGGFADIMQGQYKGCTVAIKKMRVAQTDDFDKIRNQFCKEVVIWNSLSHPNVLKLVGVLDGYGGHQFATVSEWMENGNIMQYIRKYPTNRLKLLRGAVQGLKYLHDANLTHGDLKGANILMTNDQPPTACLADFGFTTLVLDPQNPMSSSLTIQGGTMSFMAPELLAPSNFGLKKSVPSQEADVYAFGLVILQVLTGEQPFRSYKPQELAYYVSLGSRPDKPENAKEIGISDSLWVLIQKCWDGNKTKRPTVQQVVDGVVNATAAWRGEMPPGGGENGEDSVVEEESDELKHVGIFESYLSEEPVETSDDDYQTVKYGHLDQNNQPPPSALPTKPRKGFRYLFSKVQAKFGRKARR